MERTRKRMNRRSRSDYAATAILRATMMNMLEELHVRRCVTRLHPLHA
jgi:hypothetical protein